MDNHEEQWESDVELLLDRKRPDVQQRVIDWGLPKIVIFARKEYVGYEQNRRQRTVKELPEIFWQQNEWRYQTTECEHDDEGRENSSNSAFVKFRK